MKAYPKNQRQVDNLQAIAKEARRSNHWPSPCRYLLPSEIGCIQELSLFERERRRGINLLAYLVDPAVGTPSSLLDSVAFQP